ncbi:MAG: hypothetical protein R2856_11475 [Caldilineaceae bacterium]
MKRHLDESIPLKYNVIGQETIGPGGFFFAMRNVPVIRGDPGGGWRSLRPRQCWSTTATPQIVAEAVTRFTDVPCISICDRCSDDQKTILRALNRPDARVTLEWIGLNHATWSTRFEIDGEDGVSEIMSVTWTGAGPRGRDPTCTNVNSCWRRRMDVCPTVICSTTIFGRRRWLRPRLRRRPAPSRSWRRWAATTPHFAEQLAADTPQLTHGSSVPSSATGQWT